MFKAVQSCTSQRERDDDDDDDIMRRMRKMKFNPNAFNVILDQLTDEERSEFNFTMSLGMHGTMGALRQMAKSKILFHDGDEEKARRGIFLMEQMAEHFHDSDCIVTLASIYEEGNHVTKDEDRAWEYYMRIIRMRKASRSSTIFPGTFEKWENLGGSELVPCLVSGAIRVLDASWLINHALKSSTNVIQRRQELPSEAFLDVGDIINSVKTDKVDISDRIQLICLSYMWLDHDHPDPHGWTLSCLVEKLKPILIERVKNDSGYTNNIIIGVFWDFASLHQKPRTKDEDTLFKEGLEALSYLYSHPKTIVYKVTKTPPDYPRGYKIANDENLRSHAVVPYQNRGWPFTESCWSSLTKSVEKTVDISQSSYTPKQIDQVFEGAFENISVESIERAEKEASDEDKLYCILFMKHFLGREMVMYMGDLPYAIQIKFVSEMREIIVPARHAPLSPEFFNNIIDGCSFTNGKEDSSTVKRLYQKFFERHFGAAKMLNYQRMNWNDEQVSAVAATIALGYTTNVEQLFLGMNHIREEGCAALAGAILSQRAPQLTHLNLDFNLDLKDSGVRALAPAITYIQKLSLSGTFISEKGCCVISDAILDAGESSKLMQLWLSNNPGIGDVGCKALARSVSRVEYIDLSHCTIGNDGCHVLIDALLSEEVPLRHLDLSMNPFDDKGCNSIDRLICGCSSTLEYLNLSDTRISEDLKEKLRAMKFKGVHDSDHAFRGLLV